MRIALRRLVEEHLEHAVVRILRIIHPVVPQIHIHRNCVAYLVLIVEVLVTAQVLELGACVSGVPALALTLSCLLYTSRCV